MTSKQFNTLEDLYQYYNQQLFEGKLDECLINLSRHGGAYGFFVPKQWVVAQEEDRQYQPPIIDKTASRAKSKKKSRAIHEISINPDSLYRSDKSWHSTLIHEMVHLWQHDFGKTSRQCYHNRQWADKMEALGLMPSDTGEEGGLRTGQLMSHYILREGAFEKVFNSISEDDLKRLTLPYRLNREMAMYIEDEDDEVETVLAWLKRTSPQPIYKGKDVSISSFFGIGKTASHSRAGVKAKYVCACDNRVWGKPDLEIQCMICGCMFMEC